MLNSAVSRLNKAVKIIEVWSLHKVIEFLVSVRIDLILHVTDGFQDYSDRVTVDIGICKGRSHLIAILKFSKALKDLIDVRTFLLVETIVRLSLVLELRDAVSLIVQLALEGVKAVLKSTM